MHFIQIGISVNGNQSKRIKRELAEQQPSSRANKQKKGEKMQMRNLRKEKYGF